ncbi:MAG: hypothetical protein WDN50_13950 [Bradyrhizobium sp.]
MSRNRSSLRQRCAPASLTIQRHRPPLQNLAADANSWTDLYLTALTQAGLLRPVDQPPEIHDNPVLVSLQATLAAGILAGPAGKQIITNGNLLQFFDQVRQWYGDDPTKTTPYAVTRQGRYGQSARTHELCKLRSRPRERLQSERGFADTL